MDSRGWREQHSLAPEAPCPMEKKEVELISLLNVGPSKIWASLPRLKVNIILNFS